MQFSAQVGVWTLGYEWVEGAEGLCLEPRGPCREGTFRWYDPFVDSRLLFQEIAKSAPNCPTPATDTFRQRITDFAGRYGLLWGGARNYAAGLNEFGAWQAEARQVQRVLGLWRAHEPSDLVELADILASRASVSGCLTIDSKPDGSLGITLQVPSLVAAVWLQIAELVNGDLEVGTCRQCHRLYEVLPDFRRDRIYCSNTCKVTAYKLRKAGMLDARGLRDETDVKPRRRSRTTKGE